MHAAGGATCSACAEKERTLQRRATNEHEPTEVPPIVYQVLRSPGQPLDPETRAFFEPRFGHDFSDVRVHTDTKAAESARAVHALAYAVGGDVVFAAGQFAPETRAGQGLLAHELTHVVQQGQAGSTTLQRNAVGVGQAETQQPKKATSEVVLEGLKTVARQAVDNNPQVKKLVIEPLKTTLKATWAGLSTSEKGLVGGFGAATAGLALGSLLSAPAGRKVLEGVNLAAPLQLIPYVPLTGFKYTLPSGETEEKRRFQFQTTFSLDDYLKLRSGRTGLSPMSLHVEIQWGYDAKTDRLGVLGGQAKLGLVPGVTLSAGAYADILPLPRAFATSEGGTVEMRQRIPELPKAAAKHDVRVMLTVDLMKLDLNTLRRQLLHVLDPGY